MTKRVDRPHLTPGRKRIYQRDSLSRTKRGVNAIKKVQKIRIKALRAKTLDAQRLRDIEKKEADRALSEKQLKFARYWAAGETPRTAAVMAGYSESSSNIGWKLSHDPAIIKLYQAEKKLYEEAAQLSRAKVMEMLKDAYDHAKLIDEPATMVAAARELGKMAGYYEPEKRVVALVGGKVAERMLGMTDEQLLQIIEQGGDVIEGDFMKLPDKTLEAKAA